MSKTPRINKEEGIPYRLQGISCLLYITSYVHQDPFNGSAQNCDSDLDYYGYEDIEWEVYNLNGFRMKFLEDKCTEEEKKNATAFLSSYMSEQRKNNNDL